VVIGRARHAWIWPRAPAPRGFPPAEDPQLPGADEMSRRIRGMTDWQFREGTGATLSLQRSCEIAKVNDRVN
jgi:hypothetical protein